MVTPNRTSALLIGIFEREFSSPRHFFQVNIARISTSVWRTPGQRSFRFDEQGSGSIAETQTNKDVTNEEQPVARIFTGRSCAGCEPTEDRQNRYYFL